MTIEEKQTLSNILYLEYLDCFEKAVDMFRECIETENRDFWHKGNEYMRKADEINLLRLALV